MIIKGKLLKNIKKFLNKLFVLSLVGSLVLSGFPVQVHAATIDRTSPSAGASVGGNHVYIYGTDFLPGSTVTIGGASASVFSIAANGSYVRVTAPAGTAGAQDVVVTDPSGGFVTLTDGYTYADIRADSVSGSAEGYSGGGNEIQINGIGLFSGTTVTIGGASASVTYDSNSIGTYMRVIAPAGTPGAQDVVVTNSSGQSHTLVGGYTYVDIRADSITPRNGFSGGGTSFKLRGLGFTAGTTVTIGGAAATDIEVNGSGSYLTGKTPAGTVGAQDVVVTNTLPASDTITGGFTYGSVGIVSITPEVGSTAGGTPVTVTGSGFGVGTTLRIGSTPTDIVVVNSTTLTAVTSSYNSIQAQDVIVTNAAGESDTLLDGFQYIRPPTLSRVSPSTVLAGTSVEIRGDDFQPGVTVTIGGVVATDAVISFSDSRIRATVPTLTVEGDHDVVVTNPDGQSVTLVDGVAYTHINVSSVFPNEGLPTGGNTIRIYGSGLVSGTTVTIGGVPATNFQYNNDENRLQLRVPAGTLGAKDVVVTNPSGQSRTVTNGYTYVMISISEIEPDFGFKDGGTPIEIWGLNLGPDTTVTVGGIPATNVEFVNVGEGDYVIRAVTPAGTVGAQDVVVTNPSGESATLTGGFQYGNIDVVSVSPNQGPGDGDTFITITGSGFSEEMYVSIGGRSASDVTFVNSNTFTAVTPRSSYGDGPADVQVSINYEEVEEVGGNSEGDILSNGFTYVSPPEVDSVSPSLARAGMTLEVRGDNFMAGATVSIGGVNIPDVTFDYDSRLEIVIPTLPLGTHDIVVTNPTGLSGTLVGEFTYAEFAVTGISRSEGPSEGGDDIYVSGVGLDLGTRVKIGGVYGTSVYPNSNSNRLYFTVPAGTAGVHDVVVEHPSNGSATLTGAYTYLAPRVSIAWMAPGLGFSGGGTPFRLQGEGFVPGTTVTIGGAAATDIRVYPSYILGETPPGDVGAQDVVVTLPSGESATRTFIYGSVDIASITPAASPQAGGTPITVTGSGFVDGTTLTIGSYSATEVVVVNDTTLTANTPSFSFFYGLTGATVQTPNGDSDSLTDYFLVPRVPRVYLVSPSSGDSGSRITIRGYDFSRDSTVTIGGVAATDVSLGSSSLIYATVPVGTAGAQDVLVTDSAGQSGHLSGGFTYVTIPAPEIFTVTPSTSPTVGGNLFTINGTNFYSGTTVTMGGVSATLTSSGSTQLRGVVPAGTVGAQDVVVTNPGGALDTLVGGITYEVVPLAITNVTPSSGPLTGGLSILIEGTGFSEGATVDISGVSPTDVTLLSDTQITATIPAGTAGARDVTVTNAGGGNVTLTDGFNYAPLSVTGVTPSEGTLAGGTFININGEGISLSNGATVTIGGVLATNVSTRSSSGTIYLRAWTPAGNTAGAQDVVVTTPDGQTSTLIGGFSYVQASLAEVTPNEGSQLGGTYIEIAGSGFSQGTTVTIGGTPASNISYESDTLLTARTPVGTVGAQDVVVTVPGGAPVTLVDGFTYSALGLVSVTPPDGHISGGTLITIKGAGFIPGTTVTLDGQAATDVTVVDETTLTAVTPPADPEEGAGRVTIIITRPDEEFIEEYGLFRYSPIGAVSISPAAGPIAGGILVTIRGIDFDPEADYVEVSVSHDSFEEDEGGTEYATDVTIVDETTLTARMPAMSYGVKDIRVYMGGDDYEGRGTLSQAFTYTNMSFVSLSEATGPVEGGTELLIQGSGFLAGVRVTIGGAEATVTSDSDREIRLTTPPGEEGPQDVVITNTNGDSFTLSQAFTYTVTPTAPVETEKFQVRSNVLRPSRGQTQMTIANVPDGGSVRIYNLSGRLLKELTRNGSGDAVWDGRNGSGESLASGVYMIHIKGDGVDRIFKAVIQR